MKYYKYLTLIVLTFFTLLVHSHTKSLKEELELIKKKQKETYQDFQEQAKAITQCSEKTKYFIQQLSIIKEKLTRNTDVCRLATIEETLHPCVFKQKSLLQEVYNLSQNMIPYEDICSVPFHHLHAFMNNVSSYIRAMDKAIDTYPRRYQSFLQNTKRKQNINKFQKYLQCSLKIKQENRDMFVTGLQLEVSYFSFSAYSAKLSIENLKILNEKVKTRAKICLSNKEDQELDIVKFIHEQLSYNQNLLADALEKHKDIDFKNWPQKACDQLNTDQYTELCENPIYNPSWIYSFDQFLFSNKNNQPSNE